MTLKDSDDGKLTPSRYIGSDREAARVDALLAAAVSGPLPWPAKTDAALVVERGLYHGIAGLIAATPLPDWPEAVTAPLRDQAIAQAIWEMRHRLVLARLLPALEDAAPILLKGTAFAYDLYVEPAQRARGDTDILIAPERRATARAVLHSQGFTLAEGLAPDRLQEVWTLTEAGTRHEIDLHWNALNQYALKDLFSHAEALQDPLPLPRLCVGAFGLPRHLALLHACAHRAKHIFSPYFVDGRTYYGGDRLIWAVDIDRLARALTDEDWTRLCQTALARDLAQVCLDGLVLAEARFATPIPDGVRASLASSTPGAVSGYLLESQQIARALRDLRAIPGLGGKLRHLLARAFPPASFLRAKYPDMAGRWLPLLHLRRIVGFLRDRRAPR